VSKLDGSFELASNNEVSFRMAGYDPKRALVIDPVLSYSTYLGGSSGGGGFGIAVDAAGNAYVTGYASSVGFPVVNPPPGACDGSCNAPAFVAKLNPSGSALVYSTYLGGSLGDLGWGIAVDAAGDAYVTGYTASMDFPTVNPLQANCGSCRNSTFFGPNAFVAELNPTGSALIYSTYLGGSGADYGRGIAVDAAGSVYVAGVTYSYDFPTANPLQRTCSYCDAAHFVGDAFVAKLNPAGSALVYSTYLGGSKLPPGPGPMAAHNQASGIAADAGGNAYVTGFTEAQDFPTANPLPGSSCGGAFVAKLNPAGSSLVYSTCVGAGAGNSIAVDVEGDAYVTGSASSNFPTVNPLPGSSCGGVFVTELNPVGGALVYSTCLGGSGVDQGNGLAVDVAGNAFVTGWTVSTNFPTANPIQPNCDGCGSQSPDAFVFKLNSTGSALVYSTFLGGSGDDRGYGIAVDPVGNTYVTGKTGSSDFPTANPLQPGYGGGNYDAFVAEIAPTLVSLSPISLTFGPQNVGSTSALQTVTVTNTGTVSFTVSTLTMGGTNATDFATSADACTGATIASNGTCTVSVAFAPSATGNRSASLSFTDNTSSSPQTVSLTGTSTAPVAGVSSLSVPFGNQNLGTASGSQPVTLSNTGSGALTITSIATTTNFGETDNCAGSVAASGSCTINVTFSPTATGPLTGALTITDNSNGVASSTQTVSLSGTGTAPLVSLSTPGLSFGSQPMSTTSGAQTVTVTNAGTGNLNISTVTMGGTNASDFAKSADTCTGATITPNSTCTVSVTFTPSATGSRSASLSFANNASNSQQTVTLSGTGTAPVVSLSAPSLSFGSQLMSTASAVQSETVTNTGTANLTISTVMMGGTNASDFAKSADTCTGATVTPNGTCTLSVTFTPSATGSRSASLNFTDNASNSPQAVPLSGTGTAPLVSLSVPGLAFGSQPVSTTSGAQAMTVTNAGAGNLIISTVTMGGANASDFAKSTDTCTAATVIPNGTCTVSLTFTPSATGSRSASLNFTDNASNSLQTVTLSGTGTAPVVSLAAPGLSFGNQLINTTSTAQAETVTNTGTANLTMSTVTMDGANASDFAKSADTCTGATIAPNGTCTVSVTFTPSASGSRSASLSFTDNASNSPQAVSLSGTAILGPMLTVSPTSMTFSAQYVGTTGLPQNVTLQNTGDQNVTISNVQASSSFGETNGCTSSLAPQVSCTIGVFFDPTASGNINGTLTITDNAPGSPHTVALSGAGQDFNFAPASGSSTSAAVAAGQAATYTLSMAGKGGLNQKVTFTCTGAPSEATCTVPSSVTAGSSATNVLVTVSTTAASVTTPRSRPLPPVPPLSPGLRGLLMLALVLATIAWAIRRRSQLAVSRWRSTMVLLASGLLLALALAGCGGGGSGGGPPPNPGTPAGTYTLTVTGSTGTGSATLSHSVALTLTVS